ncbi:hypothetical protein ABZV15_23895 [Streptomyces sp. NPDC005246]|uniref:hypothetical protein n=1 Tax=Streptomyces sp. NPDC005246 TaxID=3156716 RepID=UPI0033A694F5
MSTMRHRLGTGPSTHTTASASAESFRLLPAERIGPGAHLADLDNDQAVASRKGRRILGTGTEE